MPAKMVDPSPNTSIAIAVMGATGTGKTTFINLVSGPTGSPLPVGDGLDSCTKEINTVQCLVKNRWVTMIDTPGFDDTSRSETAIIRMIAHFLTHTYEKGLKLSGVIYMHRISDNRMGGLSQRNFNMFKEMCGIEAAKNVVIVTTMWDEISPGRGEPREKELKTVFFKSILDQGAQLLRNDNTQESALGIIAHFIENQPVALRIQQEIVDEHKDLDKTAAGAAFLKELAKQQELHRNEINALKEEMNDMIKEKTTEIYEDQQRLIQLLAEKVARVEKEAESMAVNFSREREWFGRQESQSGSNQGGGTNFAAHCATAVNMALQAGLFYGRFIAPSTLPLPLQTPGITSQVSAAVVNMFRYLR